MTCKLLFLEYKQLLVAGNREKSNPYKGRTSLAEPQSGAASIQAQTEFA